jgi:uncharacterized protein (DUF885 family)
MDRRHFLTSTAAGGAASLFAAPALLAQTPAKTTTAGDRKMAGLMEAMAQEDLRLTPQLATQRGLDVGALAAQRSRLNDNSRAARQRNFARSAARLRRLNAIPDSALSEPWRMHRAVVAYAYEREAKGGARYRFGDTAGYAPFSPFVISQQTGAYYTIPDFLASQHPVATRADAEAWLARLAAFPRALDANTADLRTDAAAGVLAPDFNLDAARAQIAKLRGFAPERSPLALKLAEKAAAAGVPGNWAARAAPIIRGAIYPALDRQLAAIDAVRPQARPEPGIWRIPGGDQFYADALAFHTTTTLTPDEVHRLGLAQVADLHARLDPLLRAQGLTKGGVGERIAQLSARPDQLYPNTDAGRADLLAYLVEKNRAIRARMPEVFRTLPADPMDIVRVPPEIEDGAPGGYAQSGSLDGKRPGRFYINLKNTAEWPRFGLDTLVYHEAIPGHLWHGAQLRAFGDIPMLRRSISFAAYNEGWAHYSEQLADELGMYEGNPLGRIGYLQALLFRAVRLVVDTGMHAKRWSRRQAIDYFVGATGFLEGRVQREVDRYAGWPGQACAYKVGHNEWVRLRNLAESRAGAAFDPKDFHDVLRAGIMPLVLLAQLVEARFPPRAPGA